MHRSPRDVATMVGSVAVLIVVIVLVSSDVETAVALGGFCVLGGVLHRASQSLSAVCDVRSRLSPRARRTISVVVVLLVVVAVTDEPSELLWLGAASLFGYIGFQSGGVLRGAWFGTVGGVLGSVAFVVLVAGALVLASIVGVPGTRGIVLQTLLAPQVVGSVTVVWTAFVVVLGGITGLVSGSVGGAIARLLQ